MPFSLKTIILFLLVFTPTLLVLPSLQSTPLHTIERAIIVDVYPPWDTIDSGVAECIVEAVRYAEENNIVLIMRVNSYGGYLDSAFTIGDAVYYSKTPVVVYVENKALSAGTLVILPADYIGLKKGSIIGAMKPVIIDPVSGQVVFVNESKILEPIIGKAKVYAERRSRNLTLVNEFIVNAKVVSSREAVEWSVADVEVSDFDEFLSVLDGLKIERGGVVYELKIKSVEEYSCSVRSRFISILSNTYLANILLTIGVLASIFALVSGKLVVLPLAVAFILLGLMGTGINPNLVSLFFILLGGVLLAVELFILPGFGIVGITGIILLLLGFTLLPMYTPTGIAPSESYVLMLRVFIIGLSVVFGGFFGIVLFKVVQVKRKKPISYTPIGKTGVAADPIGPGLIGYVKIEGEYWRAVSSEYISPGEEVVVVEMREDGILVVAKKK